MENFLLKTTLPSHPKSKRLALLGLQSKKLNKNFGSFVKIFALGLLCLGFTTNSWGRVKEGVKPSNPKSVPPARAAFSDAALSANYDFSTCSSAILSSTPTGPFASYTFSSSDCQGNGFTAICNGTNVSAGSPVRVVINGGTHVLRFDRTGSTATVTSGQLKSTSGAEFQLKNFTIQPNTNANQTITISALKDGSVVSGSTITLNYVATASVFQTTYTSTDFGTKYNNIDEIDVSTTLPTGVAITNIQTSSPIIPDTTPPTISIGSPSATIAKSTSTVTYTVTYTDANFSASTLAASDITLNGTGVSAIKAVTGTGTTRTVTLTNITGDGPLGISIAANTASDVAGNQAPAAGPSATFAVDNTAPTIGIGSPSVSLTAGGPVSYTVTYSDGNFSSSTLTAGNITVNSTSGNAAAGSVAVSGSGTTRTVTLSSITGTGNLGISIAAGTATDAVGNSAPAAGPSATFAVDNTAPTIGIGSPSVSLTAGGPVSYTVTYSDGNFSSSTLTAGNITVNSTSGNAAAGSVAVSGSGTTRTVTLSSITGTGNLGISIAAGTATDAVGNSAPAAGPSTTFAVDNTAPTIGIGSPSVSLTAGGPVSYTVTYSDGNFSSSTLTAGNITVNSTSGNAAAGSVAVSGSGTTRTVTLSSITGTGNLGISIAAGTATDAVGNSAPAAGPSTTFAVDNTAPTVTIAQQDGINPVTVNGSQLDYTVTFSKPVTGVDATDFVGTTTGGVSQGTISYSPVSSTVYNVSITNVTGDGTYRLDLKSSGTGITDAVGNTPAGFTGGDVLTIDNTPPSIAIGSPSVASTKGGPVTYAVTYSGFQASTLTTGNISLNSTGTATGTIGLTGSGASYTVTISNISGSGTLGFTIAAGTATDNVGNSSASATSGTFTVTPTTVTQLVRNSANPTTSTTVNYYLTFADAVTGLSASNFTVSTTGTITGATVGTITGSGTDYAIDVNYTSGAGTIILNLNNATGLSPSVSNVPYTGATFTIDRTPPVVTNVFAPADGTYGRGGVIAITVAFDEPVIVNTAGGVPYIDVTLNSGTVRANYFSGSTATQLVFNYTVQNGDMDDNGIAIGSSINLNGGTIADFAGNSATSLPLGTLPSTTGVLVDGVAPEVSSIVLAGTSPTNATSVDFTVTFSKAVSGVQFSNFSIAATGTATGTPSAISGSGGTYKVTVSGVSGDGTLGINLNAAGSGIFDDNSNQLAADFTGGSTYTIDNTAPTIAISAPSKTSIGTGTGGTVTYDVTYTNYTTSTLGTGDITLNSTGAATGTVGVTGSGGSYTVTISNINGLGTLGISIGTGTASDAAGNSAAAAGPSATFDVVSSTATLGSISLSPPTKLTKIAGTNYADYIAKVFSTVHSVKVIPVLADAGATITINGDPAISGVESAPITLNSDTTAIAVTVTAVDGVTKHTYRMVITRLPSTIALLKKISLSPTTTLTKVTGPDYADYTAHVFSPASSIKVIPVTADNTSTVTVNGVPATSGVESAPVTLNADTTAIAVTVTAGDGVSRITYRIVVTRSPNANLASIALSPAISLAKITGPDYADYTASIYHSATSVKVMAVTADAPATITVNGVPATSGVLSAPVPLHGDTTSVAVTVTAGDGITKNTYKILVTRLPSGNAVLASLSLSPSTPISKVSGPDFADYTAHVFSPTNSLQVIPTTADNAAAVTVNGVPAISGVASAPVTLNSDTTAIAVTVTAADGVSKLTYRIVVNRTYNAYLSDIALSPATTLTKELGVDYADYTATVSNSTHSVKVIPTTAALDATVTVNGVAATPGVESAPVTLNTDTTAIAVTVTGGDGTTKNTYRIVVHRLPLTNAVLKSLALNPTTKLNSVDGPDYSDYTATVPSSVHSVKVIPVTADASFTVTVNGIATISGAESAPVALNADTTAIAVTVTAGDGVSKLTYRMVITRIPSNNAVLKSIAFSPTTKLNKVAGPDYADYTATVPNSTSTLQVIPTAADNGATITVNSVTTLSGATSAAVTLNAGTTTITTTVTAEDGVTVNSYVVQVTQLAPGPHDMAYQPSEAPIVSSEIVVHQNVSPNGDGRSDVLTIDGITAHPDNKLQIMSRSGALIYEAKGYDNATKVFDGHATDGKLQQAGTYFYSLEYKDGNETKHKTGYIVLKY